MDIFPEVSCSLPGYWVQWGSCFQERSLELALLLNTLESCWDSWELGWETLHATLCPSPWCGRGQARPQCSSAAGLAPDPWGWSPCLGRGEPHRHRLSPEPGLALLPDSPSHPEGARQHGKTGGYPEGRVRAALGEGVELLAWCEEALGPLPSPLFGSCRRIG